MNLDRKIFGEITIKEIIGTEPSIDETQTLLQNQFDLILNNLESNNQDGLKELLELQIVAEKEVNNRPGAMALAQNKIKIFTEFNQKLIDAINRKLES